MKRIALYYALSMLLVAVIIYRSTPQQSLAPQHLSTCPRIAAPMLSKTQRPVYPFSLVPGGVQSVAELRMAFNNDPAYAANFPGFNFAKTRVIRIHRLGYVSFLRKGTVGWTSKPQLFDEQVITDGRYILRMRCGNSIVYAPQVPTIPAITPSVLDTPTPAIVDLPPELLMQPILPPMDAMPPATSTTPSTAGPQEPGIVPMVPPSGMLPIFFIPGVPPGGPLAVPEPGTIGLTLLAIFGMLCVWIKNH